MQFVSQRLRKSEFVVVEMKFVVVEMMVETTVFVKIVVVFVEVVVFFVEVVVASTLLQLFVLFGVLFVVAVAIAIL